MSKNMLVLIILLVILLVALAIYAKELLFNKKGEYAFIQTNKGLIVCELFRAKAPLTVENFTSLATGKKAYLDHKTNKLVTGNFFEGIIFHRVIEGFMIQTGDPTGTGRGGPGYAFKDEIHPSLNFSEAGLLAMANAGPNTNGSQFFITTVPTPWLNNNHTIFGKVVYGFEVALEISKVKRDMMDKPIEPVIINAVNIVKIGDINKELKSKIKEKK